MAVPAKPMYEAAWGGLERAARSALAGELGFAVALIPAGPAVEVLWDEAPRFVAPPPTDAVGEAERVRVVDPRPFAEYSRVARSDLCVGAGAYLSVSVEAARGSDLNLARSLSPSSAERVEADVAAGLERCLRDARAAQKCATLWLSHIARVVVEEDAELGVRLRVDVSLATDSVARLLDEAAKQSAAPEAPPSAAPAPSLT